MESPTRQSDFVHWLSRLYREPLLTYLTQLLGRTELAREVGQDTFAKLPTPCELERVHFPRALLFRVATNLALIHLRHQSVEGAFRVGPDAMEKVPGHRMNPHGQAMSDEIGRQLATVIQGLRPSLRKVLVIAHVHGMTAALRQCRERLAARGIDLAEFD